jgi:programmed cell death 8 (apoptosis-inducing factor)
MWRSWLRVSSPLAALAFSSSALSEPVPSPADGPGANAGDKMRLTRRFTRRKQTKQHRYVIVGSGTAASAAIEAIRQEDAAADILVLSDEHALPRLDSGRHQTEDSDNDSDSDEELLSPALLESYNEWRRHLSAHFEDDTASASANSQSAPLTLLLDKRPLELDVEKNCVLLGDGTEVRYERCLIASAGRPRHFYVLDSDRVSYALKDRVNTCTTRADFARLDQLVDDQDGDVQSVLVIGAGFLGCEVACALATDPRSRLRTKLVFVEQAPAARTLPPYLAEELARRLSRAGVDVVPDRLVTSLRPSVDDDDNESDCGVTVGVLGKDQPEAALDADYVVLASTHTDPAPTLRMGRATRAGGGLERDEKNGGLVVNAQLEAVSGLFVAGNAASYYDPYLGRRRVDRYDHAVNSGLTAGRNMARSLRGPGKMKTYRHQPLFRSHLSGVGVLIEGIGEVDSSLRTVGVWVQPPNVGAGPNGARGVPYERGVVYYLKGNKIMGILLWNASDVLESARQLMLSRPEIRDNVVEELKHTISLAPNEWLHVVST